MNLKELALQAKELAGIEVKEEIVEEVKANEVMNTGATNFWTELVPTNVVMDPALDLLPKYSSLLNLLPWNHGNDMPVSAYVPVIGEAELFSGNTEWTTGAISFTPANNWPQTDKVLVSQGQFILDITISRRELNYSVVDLENVVRERINRAAARTIDASIINADTASSGNINGTYSGTAYYAQQDGGIRKTGIANSAISVGALTSSSLLSVKGGIDAWYQADLDNLLFITPSNVYDKMLGLSEVITMDKFWPNATIVKWVLAKAFGIDVLVARDFPALTDTTGKVSTTLADNVKGSFACIYKPAVQYGFGQPLEIELSRVPWKGVRLTATMEFGFGIANSKAGLWKTVALWVNVTVA